MKPTYHIASHSHWDRERYKTFDQFRAMPANMVDDLLDLLRCGPRYAYFTLDGQTVVLDDYLAVRQEQEEELRRLVAGGSHLHRIVLWLRSMDLPVPSLCSVRISLSER